MLPAPASCRLVFFFFFFFFSPPPVLRPVFTDESGVIVRSRYEQQARQKPDEPADSLGKHLTKNDAGFPRAVSNPFSSASFCFNRLRSPSFSDDTYEHLSTSRAFTRNRRIYARFSPPVFYSRPPIFFFNFLSPVAFGCSSHLLILSTCRTFRLTFTFLLCSLCHPHLLFLFLRRLRMIVGTIAIFEK